MNVKKNYRYVFLFLFSLVILTGCGGSNSTKVAPETNTAYLIDSAVEGVAYECGDLRGLTDARGKFLYKTDCTVTFNVGNITLGSISGSKINTQDKKLYIPELVGLDRNNTINTKVLKVLRFIQSIDNDHNVSNGITITKNLRDNLTTNLNLISDNVSISEINNTVTTLGFTLVSTVEATRHYRSTLRDAGIISNSHSPIFISSATLTVNENQTSALTLSATDSDGDILTYSISGTDASSFNINTSSGVVTFKTAPDYESKTSYSFTAKVSDGEHEVSQDVTINIANLNDNSPIFTSSNAVTVNENQTTALTLTAIDADSDTLTYSLSGADASSFNIDSSSGVVTFKTAPDYESKVSYSFTAKVNDGTNETAQTVTLNLRNLNDNSPQFTSSSTVSVNENQLNAIDINATDQDGDTLTYTLSGTDASSFHINSTTGVVTFKIAPDYESKTSYSFIVKVSDGTNETIQTVTLSITNLNDNSPVFTSSSTVSVNENQTSALTLTATDADSDTLTYSISGTDASNFNINSATGVITFKSAPDYQTKIAYTFTAKVSDGVNETTQIVTINILPLATAKLGNLANANVTIYKVEDDGTLTSLYTETTSSSPTLNKIGKFNMHLNELDDNTFYLYKVIGGEDWDADDDGNKDATSTTNRGTIRAIAKGSDVKAVAGNFIVSYETELVYEKIVSELKYNFDKTTFQTKLQDAIKKVITDVDGDGSIDEKDMLSFDPQVDEVKLQYFYKRQTQSIKDALHSGKIPTLNLSSVIGSYAMPTDTYEVAISNDGTKAYVADYSRGIIVMDISDPSNLIKLGSYDTTGYANDIVLSSDGTKAYVADGSNGIVVLDISDSSNPTKLGSYDTDGGAIGITLSSDGTKAYVADSMNGLVVIDINDPSNPTKLGSYDTADYAIGITLSSDGTKAYVADRSNGLVVINISDPSNPTKLGSYNTAGSAHKVTLSSDGTKAYIADYQNGLVVIDISNSSNLTKLGSYDTIGNANDIILSDDGTKAYVSDRGNGLVVIDISDPSNPIKLGSYDTANDTACDALGVTLSGDNTKAYIADYYNGLVVIDISDFSHSTKLGSYDTTGSTYEITLSNDGTKAYVADNTNGLVVIDISDPANPSRLGSYDTASDAFGVTLSRDNTKAYIADRSNGLVVLDISDPSNPTKLGSYDTYGSALDVTLSSDGTKAYVADWNNGLVVIDISDPVNLTKLGLYNTAGYANDVTLSSDGTKAYVADRGNGLVVLDISDPSNPTKLGSYNTAGYAEGVTLSNDGTKAYVADHGNGLVIIDISDSSNPMKIGSYNTAGDAYGVTLSNDGTKAYVADYNRGLIEIDISDPLNLTKLGSYNIADYARDITLTSDGSKAYIADGDNGLVIIDLELYK